MKPTPPLNHSDPPGGSFLEAPAWQSISGVWRPVYGGFEERGISIEWHEFSCDSPLDWGRSFHPESLEVCLNFTGTGIIRPAIKADHFSPEEIAIYTTAGARPEATRPDGHIHRFATLEFSADFLRQQFSSVLDGIDPRILDFIENPAKATPMLAIGRMSPQILALRLPLLEPPVNRSATDIWYQSKVLEIASQVLFKPDSPAELFCHRHKRLNRERVERARYLLERDYENPPTLDMLAAEVDCSPFYLSRIFAQEAGSSIPKYLRQTRIHRAAELLKDGNISMTDAAMAVGYTSLSAFNKAFGQIIGCQPSAFAQGRNVKKLRGSR